ncbi:SRPBCC family protein [Peribacillus butanolivorans]|uniref:SRPBCC family protein n=1 Tax=Peribacillus butanolivorans TaxID=421767 RepID=UPI003647FC3F
MDTQVTTKFKILKPVNEVYEAIVDPEQMSNYWFSSGTGRVEQGKTITWRYDEYNAEVVINVLEVEEDKKIVFSWGGYGQETVVTITLKELDNTSTIIEVNELGFKEDDPEKINKMIGQKEGWVYMLTCLKGYLENGISNLRASLIH